MGQLKTVRLYGRLGVRFGRAFNLVLESNTVGEAVRALCCQLPGLREYLMKSQDMGVGYAVFTGKTNITADNLAMPTGGEMIRIAPVIMGSKSSGLFSIVLGAALVVAGAFLIPTGPIATAVIGMGVSMIAGGVVQLLSPKAAGVKNSDSPDNAPSYVFNGAVNTQAQGNPVPLGYGRMIVGSAVISAGIRAEDYAPATAGVTSGVTGGNAKMNFYG